MLNSQEFQQGIQAQQLVSNAGQQAITNETQGRVGDDGRERAQVLSAAQIADQQKSGHVAMAILASKGQDSEMARMSDPNYAAAKMASVAQQSRLKGLA